MITMRIGAWGAESGRGTPETRVSSSGGRHGEGEGGWATGVGVREGRLERWQRPRQ